MFTQLTLGVIFWWLIGLSIASLAILSLAGFLGRFHYLLDICEHFRMQYSFFLVCFFVISFLGGNWILGSFALFFSFLNFFLLLPLFISPTGWGQGNQDVRLLLANVLKKNQSYSKFIDLVKASQPDIIALVEPNQRWIEALESLSVTYPYQLTSLREDNYGLALFSRFSFEEQTVEFLTTKGIPTLLGKIRINGKPVTVIVTHPPPPKNQRDASLRDLQIAKLAELAHSSPSAIILCGDFNITPWSVPFRRLERLGNLLNTSRGFGYQPTWPVDRPWLGIPIDHCLVSKDIMTARRSIGAQIGSDHLPVILDLKFDQTTVSPQ